MPKGGQEQQGGGGGDNSLDFLWIVVAAIIGIMLIWYFGKSQIAAAICLLRYYEIAAIKFIVHDWVNFVQWIDKAFHLTLPVPDLTILNKWQHFTATNQARVQFATLAGLSTYVGSFLRYPIALILALLTAGLYFGSTAQRFKTFYNMKQLKTLEKDNWPQITPITKLDLIKTNLDEAPWAMAKTPLAFCKQHQLLNEEKNNNGQCTVSLKRGAAFRVLALQLGPHWVRPEALPMYLQAMFAIFTARINDDKKSADQLVNQIAASAAANHFDFTGVKELLAKHKNSKAVRKTIGFHAYVTTAMASLLEASREAGVLATSEFIWLKTIDRRMWYMFNSVGRPTAVAEIAGAYAHWISEKKLGLPLNIPMVDEAVTGLELALKEIIYKPDED